MYLMKLNRTTRKYFKKIKAELICNSKEKKQIKKHLLLSLQDYQEHIPNCTYDDLCNHFGNPEDYAESIFEETTHELRKKLIQKNRLINILFVFIIILILSAIIYIISFIYLSQLHAVKTYEIRIEEGTTVYEKYFTEEQ